MALYSRLYYSFQKYISIHYDITITVNTSSSKWTGSIIIIRIHASCMDQNLSNLDLKLLTDSADTRPTLSGKLVAHI